MTGSPKLPVLRKLIEIPAGASVAVRIVSQEFRDYNLSAFSISYPIIPTQPPVPKTEGFSQPFEYDSLVYSQNAFTGGDLVTVEDMGVLRSVRTGLLTVSPLRYNPVTGKIRVYTKISFEIAFNDADISLTLENKARYFSPYFNGVTAQFLNFKPLEDQDNFTHYPVKYVIVSPPAFQAILQPFVQWKTRKGFTVIEAYTNDPAVGTTTASIKAYLQGLYNAATPSDPAPSFVLLVGDVAQVPTYSGTAGTHPTDLYYCEYTGDHVPDVFYGRFSATTEAQLQPQIDKTLEYEQYLFPDPGFLNQCVMIAGVDATHGPVEANGQINYGTTNYFNAAHGLTSHTYLYPASASSASQIIQDVSNGCCYANYTAHGSSSGWYSPSFSVSNIATLANAHKYPLMVGNACLTNKFDVGECFGEALLRASNKGALGYIGASDNSYWDGDFYWSVGAGAISSSPTYAGTTLGAYDRTFHDHGELFDDWYVTQDQMIFGGNLAVMQGAPSSATYYWEMYHLMGDPSLMVYFSVPPQVTATYNPLIPVGSTSFSIVTEPYAYIGISRNNVLAGATIANASGSAVVPIVPFTTTGAATLVITKQNRQPLITTVPVDTPSGAVVMYSDHVVNDSLGNNNGAVDLGEQIFLSLTMSNIGQGNAGNVTVKLRSTDAYIVLTDSTENYGTIATGAAKLIYNSFAFNVLNDIPDGHTLTFQVIATDGTLTWNSNFSVQAHAPVLQYLSYTLSDPAGNNNGLLDPGETATLVVSVKNDGTAAAYAVSGSISWSDPYLAVPGAVQYIGDIAAGATVQVSFVVAASSQTPVGHVADLSLQLDGNYGITAESDIALTIGQVQVLVLDLDPNTSSGPAIRSAIQDNGVAADYLTSFPANLSVYQAIFVCLGIYSTNHQLTTAEGTTLATFLNGGNKRLYMEGGDTWAYDTQTAVHSLFKITGSSDGAADLATVLGQAGTFTQGMTLSYTGENNWMDHIGPTSGSTANTILANQSPAYGTAVAYDGGTYKTIGAGHEFGGLTGSVLPGTPDELMRQYLLYFDMVSDQVMANFTASPVTVCQGDSVHFQDISSGPVSSRLWNFPGGSPSTSTASSVTVAYNIPGVYDVTLYVAGSSSSDTLSRTGYITVLSAPSITQQPLDQTVGHGDTAIFSLAASGAGSFQWQESQNSGVSWSDLAGGALYAGCNSSTLTISGVTTAMDQFLYRCKVSGTCPPEICSGQAVLNVTAASQAILVSVPALTGVPGAFSVPVMVGNCSNVAAISLALGFDTGVLSLDGFEFPNPELATGNLEVNASGNRVMISWISLVPANIGNDTLLVLSFEAQTGTSALTWDTVTTGYCQFAALDYSVIPSHYVNGSITAVLPPTVLAGCVSYYNTQATPLSGVDVLLKASEVVVQTASSDGSGNYAFAGVAPGTYEVDAASTKPWGGVNSADALAVMKHFTGLEALPGIRAEAADVDASGYVNSLDALNIAKRYVGILGYFLAGDWIFEKNTVVMDGLSSQTNNFRGLCVGDVNGSFLPTARTGAGPDIEQKGILGFGSGEEVFVPLTVSEDCDLSALSLAVGFPSAEYSIESVSAGPSFLRMEAPEMLYNIHDGQVRIAWYSIQPVHLYKDNVLLFIRIKQKFARSLPDNLAFRAADDCEFTDPRGFPLTGINLACPRLAAETASTGCFNVWPNPAVSTVTFSYSMPRAGNIACCIYNSEGTLVRTLRQEEVQAGSHTLNWDGCNDGGARVPSGLYTARLVTSESSCTMKIILSEK